MLNRNTSNWDQVIVKENKSKSKVVEHEAEEIEMLESSMSSKPKTKKKKIQNSELELYIETGTRMSAIKRKENMETYRTNHRSCA